MHLAVIAPSANRNRAIVQIERPPAADRSSDHVANARGLAPNRVLHRRPIASASRSLRNAPSRQSHLVRTPISSTMTTIWTMISTSSRHPSRRVRNPVAISRVRRNSSRARSVPRRSPCVVRSGNRASAPNHRATPPRVGTSPAARMRALNHALPRVLNRVPPTLRPNGSGRPNRQRNLPPPRRLLPRPATSRSPKNLRRRPPVRHCLRSPVSA